MSFLYDPRGREGIGVVQPAAGTDYPLIQPSADMRDLLADFYLAYDDPGDYGGQAFVLPFRIVWLFGFGTDVPVAGSIETPLPTHTADLLILDATEQVVFDSTTAVFDAEHAPYNGFAERDWGDRLHILEWYTDTATCRAIVHTKWSPDDDPVPHGYPDDFQPAAAILDARTCYRTPRRVRSLQALLTKLRRIAVVEFAAGYNMQLAVTSLLTSRYGSAVTFAAVPGSGQGIYPGCDAPPSQYIRKINGVGPSRAGHFQLAANACYFVRQPMALLDTAPRRTYPQIMLFPGNQLDLSLPAAAAGTTKEAAGWPLADLAEYAHLQFGNDCKPCCDCPDYAAVAEYMNQVRDTYSQIGSDAATVREQYHANRDRWLAARECAYRHPLQLLLQPQLCPYLDVAIQYTNQSSQCVTDLTLTVDFATAPDDGSGRVVPGYTTIVRAAIRNGRRVQVTERYTLGGEWPAFTANWDVVYPGMSVVAKFRLQFADCGTVTINESRVAYAVTAILSGELGDSPIMIDDSASPGTQIPATEQLSRVLDCPATAQSFQSPTRCIGE